MQFLFSAACTFAGLFVLFYLFGFITSSSATMHACVCNTNEILNVRQIENIMGACQNIWIELHIDTNIL